MKTVHKLTLDPAGRCDYELPQGAEVLSAREQGSNICVWYLCDPSRPPVTRRFLVFGTGRSIAADVAERLRFIGMAHLSGGALVFHVFEEVP